MCSLEDTFFPAMLLMACMPPLTVVMCLAHDEHLQRVAMLTILGAAMLLTIIFWGC